MYLLISGMKYSVIFIFQNIVILLPFQVLLTSLEMARRRRYTSWEVGWLGFELFKFSIQVSILDLRRFIDTQIRVKFCGGRVERGPEGL